MPPKWHLDIGGRGDESLLKELWRVKPDLHILGHLHASRRIDVLVSNKFEKAYE